MIPEIGKRYIFQHENPEVDDAANGTVVEVMEVITPTLLVALLLGTGDRLLYNVHGVETGIDGDVYANELTPVEE